MKYEWISTARFISWRHEKFFTLNEARARAKYLKSLGANTVINSGFHFRFDFVDRWPKIKESLANIVAACHENSLRVIEHHSATFVPPKSLAGSLDGVPLTECAVIDFRDGKPAYFEAYKIIMLCCNNPKFRKIYFDYILNLAKDTGIDGLMSDDIEFCPTWYVCGCKFCVEKFNKSHATCKMPSADDPCWGNFEDPWFRSWLRFRMRSVGDYYVDLRKAMNDAGLNIPLLGCLAGASSMWLSQRWGMTGEEFARGVDLNFYEAFHNSSSYYYLWRSQCAEISYYLGIGRHFGKTGGRTEQPMFTLHYTKSAEEQFFVWALNLVMADRLWLSEPVEYGGDTYRWESEHEELFKNPRLISNIAVLFSRQTRDIYGGISPDHYLNEWLGWSQMLLEANIPYDTILDLDLAGDLSRYKLLILPNAACLSGTQVEAVQRYVKSDGAVIATNDTAGCDETGARLAKNPLADWIAAPPSNFVYYKDKVGAAQVMPDPGFEPDQIEIKWNDTRDAETRERLLAEVRRAAAPLPWQVVEGNKGVLVSVHQIETPEGKALVAHLLNVAPLDLGKQATFRRPCDLTYAPKSLSGSVTLEIRTEFKITIATIYSPDNREPVQLPIESNDNVCRIRINPTHLRRYGAIKLELRK